MVQQCRNCMQFKNGIVLVFPCRPGLTHDWVKVSIERKPEMDPDPPKRAA